MEEKLRSFTNSCPEILFRKIRKSELKSSLTKSCYQGGDDGIEAGHQILRFRGVYMKLDSGVSEAEYQIST